MNKPDEIDDLDEYNEIEIKIEMNIKRIEGLSKWQAVAFSATCAERVAPVCYQLGRERTWAIFKSGLNLVWAASMGEQKKEEVDHISHALKATPEAYVDNSDLPEYYVIKVLLILDTALEAITSEDGKEPAESLCSQMCALMAEFDATFEQFFILPTTSGMDKEQRENTFVKNLHKKPGFWQKLDFYVRTYFNRYVKRTAKSLEAREPAVQQDVLNVFMAQTEPSVEIITQLRHQAQHLSKTIEQVAPLIVNDTTISRQKKGNIPETYETITATIHRLSRWQAVSFSAACVERVALVFHQGKMEQRRSLFESGLNLLWAASMGEGDLHEVEEIQRTIYTMPEARIEDLDFPELCAWKTLCILADALETIPSDTGRKPAQFVCDAMFELTADFDFFLNQRADQTETGCAPPNAFLSREAVAQQEVLTLLMAQTGPSVAFITRLREQAQQFSKQFEKQLPHLFEVIQQEFEMMEQEEDDSE